MDLSTERRQLVRELQALYADKSKHSVYQSLPEFIADELGLQFNIDEKWRGDAIRLRYILRYAERMGWVRDGAWCDFGANTGFFSLSLAHEMPHADVLAIEANVNHARFVKKLARAFKLQRLRILDRGIGRNQLDSIGRHDFLLHLNVLHHAGADFDFDQVKNVTDFPAYARNYLSSLRLQTNHLVFQMGWNLWGNKEQPIFPAIDDVVKLKILVSWLVDTGWKIEDIAYATHVDHNGECFPSLDYKPVSAIAVAGLFDQNFECALYEEMADFRLYEHPGEFYRRPLIICRVA
ncbi:MAG: hypothetical protein WBG44_05335 [Comamonas sp.]|nr:hypothetical protein [Comamonas sp.]